MNQREAYTLAMQAKITIEENQKTKIKAETDKVLDEVRDKAYKGEFKLLKHSLSLGAEDALKTLGYVVIRPGDHPPGELIEVSWAAPPDITEEEAHRVRRYLENRFGNDVIERVAILTTVPRSLRVYLRSSSDAAVIPRMVDSVIVEIAS